MVDEADIFSYPEQTLDLRGVRLPSGLVLDVGGGGEGVIGAILADRAVSIDLLRSELDEAQCDSSKMVMDAARTAFRDAVFDGATFFFSLMFMPPQVQRAALGEAQRVLKDRGTLLVWDMSFRASDSDRPIFMVPLRVLMPGGREVDTGYGCRRRDLDAEGVRRMAEEAGLVLEEARGYGGTFFLRFRK